MLQVSAREKNTPYATYRVTEYGDAQTSRCPHQ